MGGGVSLIEGVEELMTTTMLIGRAISAMSFPGMYRIYDFHSKKAPKLRNARQFTFFAPDSDDEDGENKSENEPDPSEYEHFFKVTVNGDTIYIENPTEANEAGWTPLHTCCMSMATVSAGIALIEETLRLGGDLEAKTIYGPGTFNKGWTALQMACGYGIDALVERLVEAGADVNAVNGFGYSCLHEACHRGFSDVVKHLLHSGKVDLAYIPSDELAAGSPFASAPCQSPLGEAARCGFYKIVQQLLDRGAPKNLANKLGWTALHEACFYHRIETVKTLLLAGCDPTFRTTRGALPYHLAGLPEIKQMLKNMGGESAVPAEDDVVDMIQVLTDLTLATDMGSNASAMTISNKKAHAQHKDSKDEEDEYNANNGDEEDGDGDESEKDDRFGRVVLATSGSHTMPVIIIAGPHGMNAMNNSNNNKSSLLHNSYASQSSPTNAHPSSFISHVDDKHSSSSRDMVKVTTGTLGDLPPLSSSSAAAMEAADPKNLSLPKKSKTNKAVIEDSVPKDMPKHFLCALTQKPMSEPMKTIYGNVYDKTAIMSWFAQQGRICPLTGLPLAEIDLTPLPELGNEIRAWILKRSLAANNVDSTNDSPTTEVSSIKKRHATTNGTAANNTDDLYDF